MSFLLGELKELNYNELVEVNGGATLGQAIKNLFSGGNKNNTGNDNAMADILSQIVNKDYGPIVAGSDTSVPVMAGSSVTSVSSNCGGKSQTTTSGGSVSKPTTDANLSTLVPSTTNGCKGAYVSYHSQLTFNDNNMTGGSKFAKSACGVTSLANEISEQYTKETGKTLTEAQLVSAIQKAVDAGKIRKTDAFVKNWGEAAQIIGDSLGLKGKWSYTDNAKDATAVIISIDTKTSERDYDGYHDHFVNDIGGGKYYDPYTNKIGYINDLHLTSEWDADDGIKSAYRYIQYSAKK